MFFRRVEVYTEVPPTTEMMNIVIHIMVEVLSILGIATKEVKQGRISKYSAYKYVTVGLSISRKVCEEDDRRVRSRGCAEEAR
jgi:hypothetical protein